MAARHGWTPELLLEEPSSEEDVSSDEDDGLIEIPATPIKADVPVLSPENSELNSIKKIIRSLVLPHTKKGMDAFHLNHEYKELEGCPIPFKELGFGDLYSFLKSIGDTVICFKYRNDIGQDRLMVRPVADVSTDHIQKLVTGQRTRKRRKNGNKKQKKNFADYKTPENRRPPMNQKSNGNYNATPRYGSKGGNNNKRFRSGDNYNSSRHWNSQIPPNFNFTSPQPPLTQLPDWNI